MSKLLRIAPAAAVIAAVTFLAPAIPAKDKTAPSNAQTTAEKDTTKHKHKKHSKANTGANAGTSQTPSTPAK